MIDSPSKLPEIDIIEVVDLRSVYREDVDEYMLNCKDSKTVVKVSGSSAQQIAELWRKLPEKMPFRCHLPPFGLRFYKDEKLILQGSICWECNNFIGYKNGEEIGFTFDGEAKVSKELLSICKSLF